MSDHECSDGTCPVCGAKGCPRCGDCDCDPADEPRCEGCGHTEGEGCGCLFKAPLTLESMGFMGFRSGEALQCPKCQNPSSGLTMTYHEAVVLSLEDRTPCQDWAAKGLLGSLSGEHLCVRCSRCHYGFPMQTADS